MASCSRKTVATVSSMSAVVTPGTAIDSQVLEPRENNYLASVLEQDGRSDELADLLSRQLDAAKSRGDAESIVALSLRLGALLGPSRRARKAV